MEATTATETAWKSQDMWAKYGDQYSLAIQDLRRRVEALEQRADAEQSSATEPSSMSNASAGLQKIQEIQEKMQEEGRTLASLFDKALEPFKAAPATAADRPLSLAKQAEREMVAVRMHANHCGFQCDTPIVDRALKRLAELEALEQRAAAPAPAADRPLWREVRSAIQAVPGEFDWVAAQLAVADWLAARGCEVSADLLRAEARRAREGA